MQLVYYILYNVYILLDLKMKNNNTVAIATLFLFFAQLFIHLTPSYCNLKKKYIKKMY